MRPATSVCPSSTALSEVGDDGAIAVEVSSFQLTGIRDFHPRVAVLLNVAEDHTDWHGSFDNYVASKARIALNQTAEDVFVTNRDDAAAMSIAEGVSARVVPFSRTSVPENGIGWDGERLLWRYREVLTADDVPLPGAAGREDVAAAAGAALEYGVDVDAVRRAVEGHFNPSPTESRSSREIGGVTVHQRLEGDQPPRDPRRDEGTS